MISRAGDEGKMGLPSGRDPIGFYGIDFPSGIATTKATAMATVKIATRRVVFQKSAPPPAMHTRLRFIVPYLRT
jgi:hypothetical protein